jgi:sarcosine oxidase subunit gamma
VVVGVLPLRTRLCLRADASLLPNGGQVAGLRLDVPVNRGSRSGERAALRLGPDEWQLCGPEHEAAAMTREIGSGLVGVRHALVDISHRHVGLSVSGPQATQVINGGCALDLSPAAFPAGSATRTLLGKAEIVLAKWEDRPAFEIDCARSYAGYVRDFLLEAAREWQRAAGRFVGEC